MTTLAIGLGLGGMPQRVAGALDAYRSVLIAAYGLSRLVSVWSGPLITVRRSSDNATLDLPAGTDGWIDTAALLAWGGSASAYVTRWWDQSGLGRHAEQVSSAAQPVLLNSGVLVTIGGKPALLSGDGMSLLLNMTSFSSLPISFFSSLSPDDSTAATYRRIASSYITTPSNVLLDFRLTVATKLEVSFGSSTYLGNPQTLSAGGVNIISVLADASVVDVRTNGVSASGSAGSGGTGTQIMMFNYPALARPLLGRIGEFILLSQRLTAPEAVALERALGKPRGVALP